MFKTLNKWIKTSTPWQTILRFLMVFLITCTSLVASFSIITFAPPAYAANACVPNGFYGSGLGNNKLYILDVTTGIPTEVGTNVFQFATAAISRDERSGRIYYIEAGTTSPRIGYYNPLTGDNGVLSNTLTLTGAAIKMAQQASTGDLFIAGTDNAILRISVNDATNVFTSPVTITPTPAIGIGSGDIAFDPSAPNTLYLTRQTIPGIASPVQLYRINVTTGASVLVGTTTQSLENGSLAFDANGNLQMEGFNTALVPQYALYQLNTSNGQATIGPPIIIAGAFPGFSDFGTLPSLTPSTTIASVVLTKRANVDALLPGNPITYEIEMVNTGNCDALGLTLTDTFPAIINSPVPAWTSSFKLTADPTQNGIGRMTPASGNGNINAQVNLSVGSTLVITATGTVSAAAATPQTITNSATVTPPAGVNLQGVPPSASVVSNVVSTDILNINQPNLEIRKTGSPTYITGSNVTFTLTIRNIGGGAANNVVVNDPPPAGTTFVSNSGACVTAFPCNLGTLNAGATATITTTLSTSVGTPLRLNNVATVAASNEDTRLLRDNTATATTVAPAQPVVVPPVLPPVVDVAIGITAPPSVPPGANFTVTLTARNVGTANADNVIVSYDVPAGVTVVSVPSGCVYNPTASTIICAAIPTFGRGATTSYDFVFKAPDTPTTLTGVARISTTSPEPNTGNNSAAATTTVAIGAPDPSLPPGIVVIPPVIIPPAVLIPSNLGSTLQAANPPVNNRDGTETVTFTLTITNTGTQTLSNVQAILDLVKTFSGVENFVVLSINSSDFLVNSNFNGRDLQNLLTNGNVLTPGATGTITFSVRVTPGSNLGPYFATATVQGIDPNGVVLTDISTAGTVPDANGNGTPSDDNTPTTIQFTGVPNLRIVKRMTNALRNGIPITNVDFNTFLDDPNDSNDNAPGWSALSPIGLARLTEANLLQSGDDLEYTVYFLSDGTGVASNAQFCDPIPAGSTFLGDTYGSGLGTLLRLEGTERPQTNATDGDLGKFIPVLTPAPSPCPSPNNPNGAVFIQIPTLSNRSPNNVGFMRFRVRID